MARNRPRDFRASEVAPLLAALMLTGCAGQRIPEDALRLNESALEVRSMQTRTYEVEDETVILAASVGVLQDMGYNLDEIERPLGVLTASKVTDADDPGEMAGLVLMDIICAAGGSGSCGYMATASDEEKFILSLVVLPRLAKKGEYTARITLQRIVYDKQQRVKEQGVIGDAETYQRIFDKLSKSIFLETNRL